MRSRPHLRAAGDTGRVVGASTGSGLLLPERLAEDVGRRQSHWLRQMAVGGGWETSKYTDSVTAVTNTIVFNDVFV